MVFQSAEDFSVQSNDMLALSKVCGQLNLSASTPPDMLAGVRCAYLVTRGWT